MTAPNPIVPADVDLRDFAFMPLDVVRLRDSDLAALESPEVCWAAVLLWCASWHQVPAASVPDDDRVLANLAGFGRVVREWQKLRDGALRGWIKCSDGRLYHPVVAEKALDAWRSKLEQRWKTECARIKKHNQRHDGSLALPEFDTWIAAGCPQGQPLPVPEDTATVSPGTPPPCPSTVPRETHSKGQGEGQGQGQKEVAPSELADRSLPGIDPPPSASAALPPPPPDFDGTNAEALNGKAVIAIASGFELPEEWGHDAVALGFNPREVLNQAERFRQYWTQGKGKGKRRSVKGWRQSWSNWLGKAAERQR